MLHPMGYRLIDALDTSQDMLDLAKGKGVYRNLFCADSNSTELVTTEKYDVVISVGTFTPGHLDGTSIEPVLKYAKVGGYFMVAVRELYMLDPTSFMKSTLNRLCADGKVELVALSPLLPYHRNKEDETKFQVWTYRVLGEDSTGSPAAKKLCVESN